MGKKIKGKLTAKEELFCQLYASDREFFGNGVESYLEAFNLPLKKYNTAKVNASILLTKSNILDRINELMDIFINDIVVDKELGFVIKQKNDLPSKVAAIREYNKVKRRVEPEGVLPQTINITITSDEAEKAKKRIKVKKIK
jgi:hypothetical protein